MAEELKWYHEMSLDEQIVFFEVFWKEKAMTKPKGGMTLDEILDKLYRQGDFEGEHREIHPDRIAEAKEAILDIISTEISKAEIEMAESILQDMGESPCKEYHKKRIADIRDKLGEPNEKT